MDELFSDAAARLAAHQKMGKPGKIAGTRKLIPHESYRLVYEIDSTKNEYSVAAAVFSCNQFDGNYSGLAFTGDVNGFTDNVLNLAIANANSQNAAWLFRASKQ